MNVQATKDKLFIRKRERRYDREFSSEVQAGYVPVALSETNDRRRRETKQQ